MKIIVLGGGIVGSAIAIDLAGDRDFSVSVADIDREILDGFPDSVSVNTICADFSDGDAVSEIVSGFDLVVGAVPGYMGFDTLKRVIRAGKNIVDISFFDEDPFDLNGLALSRGVTAIIDCGIAPGFSNILAGYMAREMDQVHRFLCYVGGLPVERCWPFEYKAPFSPIDVLEEYTRPARIIQSGTIEVRDALSEPELIFFDGLGHLEAFNTDGLRTLLKTMTIPEMREKTMRYPGHIEKIRILRDSGFFSKEPVDINGTSVTPLDLTTKLLFPRWKFDKTEEDLTVMRVIVEGVVEDKPRRHIFNMIDRFDKTTGTLSMARTTGYTCSAVVRMVAKNLFTEKGLIPPEQIGSNPACYQFLLNELEKRNIHFDEIIE